MNLIDNFSNSTKNVSAYLQNNSPKILSASSVVLEVGAVVTTGIATWKAKDIIEEHNVELECMHEKMKKAENEEEILSIKKDILKLYANTAFKLSQLYAVPVMCTAGSITCNRIATQQYEQKIAELQKNIAILSASYIMLKKAYDEAKKRAEEKLGEEKAADIFYGSTEKEVEVTDKKGRPKVEKVKEFDPYGIIESNPCAILLGEGIESDLQDNRWYDINYMQSLERKYTYVLNAKGYVLVQDIYRDLGVRPQSKFQHDIWASYGWIKDQSKIDNYISKCHEEGIEITDEGITNANKIDLGLNNFVNGRYISGDEPTVWIIPNCLGDIMPFIFPDGQKRKYDELMTP
jgi:hypothetical protein